MGGLGRGWGFLLDQPDALCSILLFRLRIFTMMLKWIGGSRQLRDRWTGNFRGELGVYERACPPWKQKVILMLATFFWRGGRPSCTFYSRVVADSLQKRFNVVVFLAITYFTIGSSQRSLVRTLIVSASCPQQPTSHIS